MQWRWLGWAGVELQAQGGETLVIDALLDPGAVFAPLGEVSASIPAVVSPTPGVAVGALVTHLHRDHADAGAIAAAVAPGAMLLEPPACTGSDWEAAALRQADAELTALGITRQPMASWEGVQLGPFRIIALPAVDGMGDPQVSWLVEVDGLRVVHLGDTLFHGALWLPGHRVGAVDLAFVPVNGVQVAYPHRTPAVARRIVMDAGDAVAAITALDAATAVAMHAEGYEAGGIYMPAPDPTDDFLTQASAAGRRALAPALGEWVAA